jgi:hypothetical protein
MSRNNLTRLDAEKRVDAQMSIELKKELADVVLDNSGDFDSGTVPQIEDMLSDLNGSKLKMGLLYVFFLIPAVFGWGALKLVEISGI